jgi:hypothetical protein
MGLERSVDQTWNSRRMQIALSMVPSADPAVTVLPG